MFGKKFEGFNGSSGLDFGSITFLDGKSLSPPLSPEKEPNVVINHDEGRSVVDDFFIFWH